MEDSSLKKLRQELTSVLKGEVSFDPMKLGIYATDASVFQVTPVAVVLPKDAEDVRSVIALAGKYHVPLVPRGGGTSLGGQAVGPALVMDFSKYMNAVLELNEKERWVRVQPGIVLDELNNFLKPYKLHFAPDPATSSRATIGGMIGNNSSGTKSIIYGITRDHVLETSLLLSDGTLVNFREQEIEELAGQSGEKDNREYRLIKDFQAIVEENKEEIRRRYPRIMRRVQGYNLDAFVDTDQWNLSKLITGSEGTLGILLEARLNLEPLPSEKILCTVHFNDLQEAIRTVAPILKHRPSAVEIMDEDVVIRARKNLSIAPLTSWIEGDPKGILVVEFFGDSKEEVEKKAEGLVTDLKNQDRGYAWPVFYDPVVQAKVWGVRKNGLGLMLGIKGDRKPLPFIEDASIPVEKLPEYIDRVLAFCREREVPVAMYAHASVGLIHVRPVLNLKVQEDIDHMKAIARYSFELVKGYGGSVSGEHGDGRIRSPFLEEYFGPVVYDAFKKVKQLFDPYGLMNPGVIIDPDPMDRNLRYGTQYQTSSFQGNYQYREDGSFAAAVEMCTGVGACRQNLTGLMCPSYRATRDEEHSTRGRANALRLAMSGQMGTDGMTSKGLYEIMDLCLSCKGCKSECPSNVDVAKLKGEFLQQYRDRHGITLRDRFIGGSAALSKRFSGWMAPVINGVQRSRVFRKSFQWLAGIDSRRILPSYARVPFLSWYQKREAPGKEFHRKVVLFEDTYMKYHETNIGISAVELLESCGYEVILANAGCCQRPRISHGFLRKARVEGEKTLRNLQQYINGGFDIVVCEPGCASALTDDLPDLVEDEQLGQQIRDHVHMIDHFLAREIESGACPAKFTSPYQQLVIHGHCHQKSLYGTTGMKTILDRVEGLEVKELDSGCCGMAGSFGYEKEHYDLSLKVGEDRLFPSIRNMDPSAGLVACGFSCRHQIAHGTGVRAKHWVEVVRGEVPA